MAIRRLKTEQEVEDQGNLGLFGALTEQPVTVEELQQIVAPTPTPEPTPAPATSYTWTGQGGVGGGADALGTQAPKSLYESAVLPFLSQGVQNIGGTIYQPQFESIGSGAEGGYEQGPLQNVLRYKEGQTGPGQTYEILDPATGEVTGTGKFKEQSRGFFGDFFGMVRDVAKDTAPLWTAAIGMGPLGGMLGGAAASGLGLTGLSAAQTAALGSAIAGGANTALQGGDLGDVLKGAVTTALPSFVLPNIPSTGTPVIDKAIQAGTQVAIRGGDVEQAVIGSLLNSGIGTAVGETGLDPKLVNAVVQAAQSGGDPQKLFSAITGAASSPSGSSKAQDPSAGYGGADPGYFDEQNEVIGLPAWAIDPYAESASLFPEFEAPLLTAEPAPEPDQRIDVTGKREVPFEQNAFEQYMQQYAAPAEQTLFPEFEAPLLTAETPALDNETAKFLRQQELAQAGESPLGGMGLNAQELPLINLSGTPAPAAAPGKAPAPAAPKGPAFNPAALFGLAALMGQQQQKPQEQYQLARTVASPFGMDLIL